jgi:hypothetical protein
VSPTTITFDLHYMRSEVMENVREYTTKQLPLQFKICVVATQNAMKQFWDISQNTKDNKGKMQALETYIECHKGLCRFLWEGGGKLEQFLSDYGGIDNNKHQYKEGEWVYPKPGEQFSPFIYHNPEYIRRQNGG